MKKASGILALLLCVFLLGGCAAAYRTIDPTTLRYHSHDLQNGLDLSYRYNVLSYAGNKKYAKKEDQKGLRIIAVMITNLTDSTVRVGRDVVFYSGETKINLVDPVFAEHLLRQSVFSYLPYLLLTFTMLTVYAKDGSNTTSTTFPVGYMLGPGITAGNMLTAWQANKNLLAELKRFNLIDAGIAKGETVYGLIVVRDDSYAPLSLRFKSASPAASDL